MKKRNSETEYQAIKTMLLANDLKTDEQVNEKIVNMFSSAKRYSVFSALAALILCLALPKFSIFIILGFCIFMAWLWSSSVSSKHYFQRYLNELENQEPSE